MEKITLCRCGGNCPQIFVCHEKRKLVIRDDNGGQVSLTFDEYKELTEKVKIDE